MTGVADRRKLELLLAAIAVLEKCGRKRRKKEEATVYRVNYVANVAVCTRSIVYISQSG